MFHRLVAGELRILICMGWFSVNTEAQRAIISTCDECVKHREFTLFLIFGGEFNLTVNGVKVCGEIFSGISLHNGDRIVNVMSPEARGAWNVVKALCSNHSMKILATIGLTGDPIAALSTCM